MRDGSAIIEVMDDGGGIDVEAMKNKALERGLTTTEALSTMTQGEIFNLMFEPGFSTAKQITNLSGRGVGMDIVKTNIERLGGSIEVESELNKGTTIRLKTPLTLSVIRALIVTIDNITYAVPESNVERMVRIFGDSSSKRIERINKSLVLTLNGRIIPVITMRDIEALAKGLTPPPAGELLEECHRRGVVKCLILKANERFLALLIDEAIETEQILVKPLPVFLQNCPYYSNVTVLGSGIAVTILDAEGIMRFMSVEDREREAAEKLPAAATAGSDGEDTQEEKQVIIFRCSGTECFAIETRDISRIEVIDPNDIQEIGKGRFINISGETVRIIRPEDYAPVKKRTYNDEKLYVLTLKNSASPTGLLVRKVLDKVEAVFNLDSNQILSNFVLGTCVSNEKVFIFLDPAAIINDVENEKQKKRIVKGGR